MAIVGAGIIGLSCAWELGKRGADVTIYEKAWPPRGASWAAAGMLAPAYEAAAEKGAHPRLFDLCMASAEIWGDFAEELQAASGIDVGYHAGPTLAVAVDADQARRIAELREALDERGVAYQRLTPDEAREMEPSLSEDVIAAMLLPSDGWVDNRKVLEALISACENEGTKFVTLRDSVSFTDRAGKLTLDMKSQPDFGLVAFGAGGDSTVWSDDHDVHFMEDRLPMALSPVEGRMLVFPKTELPISNVVRAGSEYAVPRETETLVGATVGVVVSPDKVLVESAKRVFPGLEKITPIDGWTGFRPHTHDHSPMLGHLSEGLLIATGHYRNGILLAPITAKIMADMIFGGEVRELAAAFSPDRFTPKT